MSEPVQKSLQRKAPRALPGRGGDEVENDDLKVPKLSTFEPNVLEPLSKEEWINFVKVIDGTKGLGFFQILPLGQKSSMPYQFNMLHVLPQDKWPFDCLPIDIFIFNQL